MGMNIKGLTQHRLIAAALMAYYNTEHLTHFKKDTILTLIGRAELAINRLEKKPKCNCHLHKNQVCDICQGADSKDK